MNTFTELVQSGFEVARIEARPDNKPAVRISNLEPFYYVRTWEGMNPEDVYAAIQHAEQDAMGYSVEACVEVQPDGEGVIDIDIATKKMHDEFVADYQASQSDLVPEDEPTTVAVSSVGRSAGEDGDQQVSWWRRLLGVLQSWRKDAPEPIGKREPT